MGGPAEILGGPVEILILGNNNIIRFGHHSFKNIGWATPLP
jgi:hypothetical protein